MKEKIELKNLPDKIWIQVGEIDIDFDNDFKKLRESNEVTWCEHKIDNWDIEYTRSSLIESLINQEVEKRIAERMPSEMTFEKAEIAAKETDYACFAVEPGGNEINFADAAAFYLEGWNACRSRLSQKTEGGEG